MKAQIVLWSVLLGLGLTASIWNWGHLYFTVLPSASLLGVFIMEYKKEQKRKKQTYDKGIN